MSNPLVDRIKLTHYKRLYKQGKFTKNYIQSHGISNYVVFLVKQDYASFIKLTPKEQYETLISKQFDISKIRDIYDRVNIAANLFNNGYTNIFSEVNFLQGEGNPSIFWKQVLAKCKRDETFYKTFINILDEKQLLEEILKDHNFFVYLPPERKIEIAKNEIYEDVKFIEKLTEDEKIAVFQKYPSLFRTFLDNNNIKLIATSKVMELFPKELIIENSITNENHRKEIDNIIIQFIVSNVKNTKLFGDTIYYNLSKLSKELEGMPDEELVKFILHSKGGLLGAKYSLMLYQLHTDGGRVDFDEESFAFFDRLSINQKTMLINVDSSYVLNFMNLNNFEKSKSTSIELFKKIYGDDVFKKVSVSFDDLFEYCKLNSKGNEKDVHPLEELKILFNDKILKSCSPEMLNSYYEKLLKNEDVTEDFRKIIQKTYGDRALAILESRPTLDVHSINSLEVFDERILDNFGEAFVHNCITYNIANFHEFLEIIKDDEKLELFKNYYSILCGIYGENIETIQRCISEFSYNEDLLRNVNETILTDEQAKNLANVLAMKKNMLSINTIEDLDNFDKIVNEELKNIIIWYENSTMVESQKQEMLKGLITQNLFGLEYISRGETPYGETVYRLLSLYDFENQEGYTDEEIKIVNILNYIHKEIDLNKIIKFIEENVKKGTFTSRDMIGINQLINKVALRETEKLDEVITTIDKLEAQCEAEKDKPIEERSVYMEIQDGVKVFYLEGMDVCFLAHNMNAFETKNHTHRELIDVLSYEGQAGTTVVCTSLVDSKGVGGLVHKGLIYGTNESKSYVSFNNSDAGTSATSKSVMNIGSISHPISNPLDMISLRNGPEVAFYRRFRDMSKISNENAGGLVYPIAIVGPIDDKETLELCKKHNIAIIRIDRLLYGKRAYATPVDETPVDEAKTGRTL